MYVRRTYAPPALPVIEPINDDYLISFGRSYADAKNMAASKKRAEKEGPEKNADGDGDGDVDGDGGSSSDDDEDSDDASVGAPAEVDGRLASPSSAVGGGGGGGGGAAAVSTPRGSLSSGRKKFGVFVANLPFALCEERKLEEIFGGFGQITSVVPTKPKEGRT